MKIEFIKRGAATRLILIFAGWSTDARYYNDCVADGWDTAVVSDYRDLTMPHIPEQYRTVYIFAYSLGVAAASISLVPAAVRVAICGSPLPVSDDFGIPVAVYKGTSDGLDVRSLMKFHLRMAGDRACFEELKEKLPDTPDISALKEELMAMSKVSDVDASDRNVRFDRVYLAEDDRIFPYSNLLRYWTENKTMHIISIKSPHAIDIASVVKDCLPDTVAIGEGFARAVDTYNENAVVQKDICRRMNEILQNNLNDLSSRKISLLEIGVGRGLLTNEWRKSILPDEATYVDLTDMPRFDISPRERYLIADAEKWLEDTDEKFDVILSASTIQWFSDPVRFLKTMKSHLKQGGLAVISTFVEGNLAQLDGIRTSPIIYRSESDYSSVQVADSICWEHTLRFASRKEMLLHIRHTGVSPEKGASGLKKIGSSANRMKITELPNELTFRPMIVVIRN